MMQNQIYQGQIEVLEAIKCLLTDFPEINPVQYINGIENKIRKCMKGK